MASSSCAVRSAWGALSPGGVSVGTRTSSRRNATSSSKRASTSLVIFTWPTGAISAPPPQAPIHAPHRLQQHLHAEVGVLHRDRLGGVVADAVLAAPEDHAGCAELCHHHDVMPGTGGD